MHSEKRKEFQYIAFAALLHDVGKFAERGGMNVTDHFRSAHEALYQPCRKHYTHAHALYTAAFFDQYAAYFPQELQHAKVKDQTIMNLAAMHHKPENALQQIIAEADRIASGLDRSEFDNYSSGAEEEKSGISVRDYRKTRLLTLFEGISGIKDQKLAALQNYNDHGYICALAKYSPESLFPAKKSQISEEDAEKEYGSLFNNFIKDFKNLPHRNSTELWISHFSQLYADYTAFIPAATTGRVIPDVSLYDHSRTTAALAAALYGYCSENQITTAEEVRSVSGKQAFLWIQGDFTGIQKYIFASGGETSRKAAKILRGRSFSVSLLTYTAALEILERLNLPALSLILHAAGRFTIIAANTEENISRVSEAGKFFSGWLKSRYYGEVSLSLVSLPFAADELLPVNIEKFYSRTAKALEEKKYRRFAPEDFGVFSDFLNRFNNSLSRPLCPYCGRRPSVSEEGCSVCADHIRIGTELVKSRFLIVRTSRNTGSTSRGLLTDPLFEKFQISLESEFKDKTEPDTRAFYSIRSWDTAQDPLTARLEISGHVPVFTGTDREEFLERLIDSGKSEEKKEELWKEITDGDTGENGEARPLTFTMISLMSKNKLTGSDGKTAYQGIEALGVLKADVDQLGLIFQKGIRENNLSRQVTLSRLLNSFFSYYLPWKIHNAPPEKGYKWIYTLFAGGDDLFLIGPYNIIINFAKELNDDFTRFAANNPHVTLSAGVSIHRPFTPVEVLSEESEKALLLAKTQRGSFSVFGEAVTWDTYAELLRKEEHYRRWSEDRNGEKAVLSAAMIYRILRLLEDAKTDQSLRERLKDTARSSRPKITQKEIEATRWRSRLLYSMARNINTKILQQDENLQKIPEDVDRYLTSLRIPLWKILYSKR